MRDISPEGLKEHLEQGDKVFLKLWKNGCGACKLSIPALERIEAADKHRLVFCQISTDEYPEIMEIAETEVLPVFFVFVDRELKGKLEGFKGLERMKEFIEEALS